MDRSRMRGLRDRRSRRVHRYRKAVLMRGISREGKPMSVLVTIRIAGDTAKFREFVDQHEDDLRSIAEQARSSGCLHHRLAVGDGFILVIDEWDSAEQFRGFFDGN